MTAHRGYLPVPGARSAQQCAELSAQAQHNPVNSFIVPPKSGAAWTLQRGQTCRFVLSEGAQVGDVNLWNLHDKQERFYSSKTRQLEAAYLTVGHRLWSCMPHVRPLATVTADSLAAYSPDADGLGVHEVLGSRCDPYTIERITGRPPATSCHQILTAAVTEHGLTESDVHDVWNIFMCAGFDRRTNEYLIKATPAKKDDYVEILAEQDLLVALSVCPCGDVSQRCGEPVPDSSCHPIQVLIGQTQLK